jgi:hypothetical protein
LLLILSIVNLTTLFVYFFLSTVRKTKYAKVAKAHLKEICEWLSKKDQSLAILAAEHVPHEDPSPEAPTKKRKAPLSEDAPPKKKSSGSRTTNGDLTLGDREEQAMQTLFEFVEDKGGSREAVENFRCRVTRKPSDGRYDTNYYNEQGRRFRSMVEVGRYLNLMVTPTRTAAGKSRIGFKKRKATTRDIDAEKKKLRKELDKLRRQHAKATKAFDDFLTEDKESRYPVEDLVLQEEEEFTSTKKLTQLNCAAARTPDVDGFAGVPLHCVPDVLMAWDFLCTFSRVISLNPIGLDDFVHALTYKPPAQVGDGDAFGSAPVYVAEAHLGLLKLLLADPSSDEWWWSILETFETENGIVDVAEAVSKEDIDLPLIRVDFAALLAETEDPLITTSWIQSLDAVRTLKAADTEAIKNSIRTAINVVANKWVKAYLRKAMKLGTTSGAGFMKRAVIWLLDRVRDARPDLFDRGVNKDAVYQKRAKVVEEVSQQMEKLSNAALTVNDDDLVSDAEESDDESDSDDEDADEAPSSNGVVVHEEPGDRPAPSIPNKPPPTLVDLLLPPGKPFPQSELLNPCSWSQMAGAAACRIVHRYKRLRNEVDDSLRQFREFPRLTVAERRQREAISTSRVLTECVVNDGDQDPSANAVKHLCAGGNYLDLSMVERICILRILIEAAYDTHRVYEVVDTNYKQRTNAIKALDTEQRKAKREAKEKAAADEAAARQDLSLEAKRNFIEEKREEIRKANENSQELTVEEIDGLTDEDILDFDEDIKADYEALPAPESYKKAEVVGRVAQIQEAAAFETELLSVFTMDELLVREKQFLTSMEEELSSLGGEDALMNPTLDRDTSRSIERLRRDIIKARAAEEKLPQDREVAIEALKDAIADGTIKSLRSAIRNAKTSKLFGPDYETNGVRALDVVRDAHMELEEAKQLKKVADAQKDLISKLNKCFIRTEPLGQDRYRNRFWQFEYGEKGHVWVEVDYVIKEGESHPPHQPGFLDLASDIKSVTIGAADVEEDLRPSDDSETDDQFRLFSRREYHASGVTACLVKRHWGCHVNESSLRTVMKGLDSKGVREDQLKKNLKEALEDKAAPLDGPSEAPIEAAKEPTDAEQTAAAQAAKEPTAAEQAAAEQIEEEKEEVGSGLQASGDEKAFADAKEAAEHTSSETIKMECVEGMSSSIGQRVRVRFLVDANKENEVARYEVGTITGWKIRKDTVLVQPEGDEFEPSSKAVMTPVWRAWTDRGNETFLTGAEVLESISRYFSWSSKESNYFESDAAFLAYRNSSGRHCGRAAEAALAATPVKFAHHMVKREAELYQRLKHLVFDNNWGGKNSARIMWTSSMKDYAFDFQTVLEGLLTLENAFFELLGGFPGENGDTPSAKELLDNPTTRCDIELETMDNSCSGLWNSRASRVVFLEITTSK